MSADEIKEKLAKLGIAVEFDEEHYTKTHRDVKALVETLLERLETLSAPTLSLTTRELEHIIFYLNRWSEEPEAAKILGKLVEEVRRRREASPP